MKENEIGFAVRKLSNAIRRDIEKSFTTLGIEPVKGINGWAISYFFENRNIDVFQRDFEEKFSIRRSTASRMLKAMEQKGFIERVSVENDARLKKIVLTKAAIEHHELIMKDIKKREEKLKKGLTETEVNQFIELTQRITANMEEKDD